MNSLPVSLAVSGAVFLASTLVLATTQTPLGACHQVNLVWIRGFIDLVAKL